MESWLTLSFLQKRDDHFLSHYITSSWSVKGSEVIWPHVSQTPSSQRRHNSRRPWVRGWWYELLSSPLHRATGRRPLFRLRLRGHQLAGVFHSQEAGCRWLRLREYPVSSHVRRALMSCAHAYALDLKISMHDADVSFTDQPCRPCSKPRRCIWRSLISGPNYDYSSCIAQLFDSLLASNHNRFDPKGLASRNSTL